MGYGNGVGVGFGTVLPAVVLSVLSCTGCSGMYTLPDVPPDGEWRVAAGVAGGVSEVELAQADAERFIAAKRVAIQCYAALADGRWGDALGRMTSGTVRFFDGLSGGGGAASVFAGRSMVVGGVSMPFDPVGDIFIPGLVDIRDDFGGITDEEGEDRKVLYAVDGDGRAREVVFVLEDGVWKLDRRTAASGLISPL